MGRESISTAFKGRSRLLALPIAVSAWVGAGGTLCADERFQRQVAPILQRIASDSRWNGNQEILALVARHPKTPSVFASRLLPSLRTSDLRMMAKMSSGLREIVRKAALREYMRRTGQRI